jgi:DNA-cytosine methyltransferase
MQQQAGGILSMITVGSLFSGIGGIDLGLERTGGFKTMWFSEIDAYASAVLKKHWPNVPNHGDITRIDWNGIERPDMLCGGFPCQDISIAGKGKGITKDTRSGLWFEFAKAIRILRPRYVLVENVAEILSNGLTIVLGDLAEAGYDAEWKIISAAEIGAPHTRKRVFVLAYPNGFGCGTGKDIGKEYGILFDGEWNVAHEETDRNGQPSILGRDVAPNFHATHTIKDRIQGNEQKAVHRFPEI